MGSFSRNWYDTRCEDLLKVLFFVQISQIMDRKNILIAENKLLSQKVLYLVNKSSILIMLSVTLPITIPKEDLKIITCGCQAARL